MSAKELFDCQQRALAADFDHRREMDRRRAREQLLAHASDVIAFHQSCSVLSMAGLAMNPNIDFRKLPPPLLSPDS